MPPKEQPPDLWDRFLGWLDHAAEWPRSGRLRRRLLLLAGSLALVVALVIAMSNIFWRDEVPRSAIAATALGVVVLVALWLFGTRGSRTALSILAALGAILVAAGAALDLGQVLSDGPAPRNARVDCPDLPDEHGFDGKVAPTEFGAAQLRTGPTLNSDALVRYPSGCVLALDGYCLGDSTTDWRFGIHDPVWFRVASGQPGYIASAQLIAGNPGNVDRLDCPEGQPDPGMPEITAPPEKRLVGPVEIAAAAPRAIQVGFAVYYEDSPGVRKSASWHQIGVDLNTRDGITSNWDSRSVPGQSQARTANVTLLAVPCMGLEFPSALTSARSYVVANGEASSPSPRLVPPAESFDAARQLACDNAAR